MIKICICDNVLKDLKKTTKMVEKYFNMRGVYYNIEQISSGLKLLDKIEKGSRYDIIIMDVIFSGMNGIEICKAIRAVDSNCEIIFLSLSREFGVESYEVNASNYLLKPLNEKKLVKELEKFLNKYEHKDDYVLPIKTVDGISAVKYRNILFLESDKHKIRLVTTYGYEIDFYGRMSDYQEILEKDVRFVRCHKGYIVNMQHVTSIEGTVFVLDKKHLVPIPKMSIGEIKKKYFSYVLMLDKENTKE